MKPFPLAISALAIAASVATVVPAIAGTPAGGPPVGPSPPPPGRCSMAHYEQTGEGSVAFSITTAAGQEVTFWYSSTPGEQWAPTPSTRVTVQIDNNAPWSGVHAADKSWIGTLTPMQVRRTETGVPLSGLEQFADELASGTMLRVLTDHGAHEFNMAAVPQEANAIRNCLRPPQPAPTTPPAPAQPVPQTGSVSPTLG